MPREIKAALAPDKRGVIWDLLLYVPTVSFLWLYGLRFWYAGTQQWLGYLLMFLGTFFLLAGAHRIAGRLLLTAKSPVAIEITKKAVRLHLKSGEVLSLLRDVRFYPDTADRSFGLSGIDGTGERHQFVIHRNQLGDNWEAVKHALSPFRA